MHNNGDVFTMCTPCIISSRSRSEAPGPFDEKGNREGICGMNDRIPPNHREKPPSRRRCVGWRHDHQRLVSDTAASRSMSSAPTGNLDAKKIIEKSLGINTGLPRQITVVCRVFAANARPWPEALFGVQDLGPIWVR
jgi:hypothetical protein